MPRLEISDQAFTQALRAAEARGVSLGEYLESLIGRASQIEEDFDALFSAGGFAYLDTANQQVAVAEYRTAEEVQAEMEASQRIWRQRTAL
jgi:phosphoribosylformylglycinamidine (FGAM) synthase-like amidotransferase family enzyme